MHCFLTERLETPVGPMVLVAKDGVVLLFEFEGTPGRIERQIRARFGDFLQLCNRGKILYSGGHEASIQSYSTVGR